jgi:hypothetical protein
MFVVVDEVTLSSSFLGLLGVRTSWCPVLSSLVVTCSRVDFVVRIE